MCHRVAYTIRNAAEAAGVSCFDIETAIRDGQLVARDMRGLAIITKQDLEAWAGKLPVWATS